MLNALLNAICKVFLGKEFPLLFLCTCWCDSFDYNFPNYFSLLILKMIKYIRWQRPRFPLFLSFFVYLSFECCLITLMPLLKGTKFAAMKNNLLSFLISFMLNYIFNNKHDGKFAWKDYKQQPSWLTEKVKTLEEWLAQIFHLLVWGAFINYVLRKLEL